MVEEPLPDVEDVRAALARTAGVVVRTPMLRSEALDREAGAQLFFKAECLQVTGSFKVRGAVNRVRSFTAAERAAGLITVSAGNAALGAAFAARHAGASLVVVMPENAVAEKLAGVRALGATVENRGVTNGVEAFARLAELRERHGYTLVHPFDDPFVIAGAATATWELVEEVPELDCLAVPASGGGLLAGALVAARGLAPRAEVFGIQPEGAASLVASLAAGAPTPVARIDTVADGLTAPRPGALNFELIRRHAAAILTVSDAQILAAMARIIRQLHVVVEPSGAAALAAVLSDPRFRGRRAGVFLSGGNAAVGRIREVLS